jgi:hypothetical protein
MTEKIRLENNEIQKIDFVKIFRERLSAIKPFPNERREDEAYGYESVGIKKLIRDAPCLTINMPSREGLELWVEDPEKIEEKHQPHHEVKKGLTDFMESKSFDEDDSRLYTMGGRILEDEDNKLYLLVDHIREDLINSYLADEQSEIRLLNLLKKYNISKVIGMYMKETVEGDSHIYSPSSKIIINNDLIGRKRENLAYINFALEHNMTNAQYLRLRIRTKSAAKAGQALSWEEIAHEIAKDDEEKL